MFPDSVSNGMCWNLPGKGKSGSKRKVIDKFHFSLGENQIPSVNLEVDEEPYKDIQLQSEDGFHYGVHVWYHRATKAQTTNK